MSLMISVSELDVCWKLGDDCELLILLGMLFVGELGIDGGLLAGS